MGGAGTVCRVTVAEAARIFSPFHAKQYLVAAYKKTIMLVFLSLVIDRNGTPFFK